MALSEEQSASPTIPETTRPSIAEFYSHKDVFITGATGFLGKCLMEKLLRSVPNIGQVMILIRPKRGKSAKERLDAILTSKVRIIITVKIYIIFFSSVGKLVSNTQNK